MALKIIKASDPITVNRITVTIYSEPGIGKTSTGSTAEKPLLLDFDEGSYRSKFRKDVVSINQWEQIAAMDAADLQPYSTVVVDTVGRALDCLTATIVKQNPKLKGYGGALSLQGYGALKSAFVGWIKLLHSFGKDVVLLCHSAEEKSGDQLVTRLDIQGGSKNEIYKVSDAMGRLYMADGKRQLNFSPSEIAYGKNPAQFPILPVPDFEKSGGFLGVLIADIKNKLNQGSAAAVQEQQLLTDWQERLAQIEELHDFNELVHTMSEESPKVKGLLIAAGESRGFKFDKKSKLFVEG